jgi:uncharacterized protein (DUF983 family)
VSPPPGVLRLAARALRLRCPWCGGGPVLESWFKLRERCGACVLALERGEPGYFVGALAFNLVALELLFVAGFVLVALWTWPDPPWDLLLWGSIATLVVGSLVAYPFTKLAWLAFDLAFRPPVDEQR